jgi:hypothetical protein
MTNRLMERARHLRELAARLPDGDGYRHDYLLQAWQLEREAAKTSPDLASVRPQKPHG